ncbi:hypothetical protein BGZ94_002601 [Podila epigama]|nr:hypothetical protein BGZ94_002601 [Podila epigama]
MVSTKGCQLYSEAYTQDQPENNRLPYVSPMSAPTLAGLGPMLIFIGGVEILRPSLEKFVDKARTEGVEVKAVVAEGRSHNYMLWEDTSTEEDRMQARQAMGQFMQKVYERFQSSK